MTTPRKTKAEVEAELAALQRDFEAFRHLTRQVAIDKAEEQGWCDDGLNEALAELGLPGKETEYTVTLNVQITFTLTTSEREAIWTDYGYPAVGSGLAARDRVKQLLTSGAYEIENTEVEEARR